MYYKTSRKDSESASSWETDPEETMEWSSERWQSTMESEGTEGQEEAEEEEEVEKEAEGTCLGLKLLT